MEHLKKMVWCVAWVGLFLGVGPRAQKAHATKQGALCLNKPGQVQKLHIKVLGYRGWKMEIVVTNKSHSPRSFEPNGLYFIPKGSPERAPQRLAASGPFYAKMSRKWARHTKGIKIPANSQQKLRLEVFCLDSHRSSPRNGQAFRLANKRLPQSLRRVFRKNSIKYMKQHKSRSHFRGANQSMIWRERNKKWIKLEGERKNERRRINKGRYQRRSYLNNRHYRRNNNLIQQRR